MSATISAYKRCSIPCQMMFVSLNSSTSGVASVAGSATFLEHLSSSPVFSGDRLTRSLVFYAVFCRSFFFFLSFCPFSFGHCVVCPPICGFWLLLWYLQTLHFNLWTSDCRKQSNISSSHLQSTQQILAKFLIVLDLFKMSSLP